MEGTELRENERCRVIHLVSLVVSLGVDNRHSNTLCDVHFVEPIPRDAVRAETGNLARGSSLESRIRTLAGPICLGQRAKKDVEPAQQGRHR